MRESAQTSEPAPMRNIERISISSADHERLERLVPDRYAAEGGLEGADHVLASDGQTYCPCPDERPAKATSQNFHQS